MREQARGEWSGKPRTWLHFGDDYQYLAGHQVGLAHIAFVTGNLDALIARLEAAGFSPAKSGADEPYRRNIYYIDPAGFELEFVQYLSDVPAQRNLSS